MRRTYLLDLPFSIRHGHGMLKVLSGYLSCILISACGDSVALLTVDDFKLRSATLEKKEAAMVRGDQNFVLFGKVSAREREQAMGHYLLIRRRKTGQPATIRVQYRQAKMGSKKLVREKFLAQSELVYQFEVTGDSYRQGGRILAWKVELIEEDLVIASEQSYMWE